MIDNISTVSYECHVNKITRLEFSDISKKLKRDAQHPLKMRNFNNFLDFIFNFNVLISPNTQKALALGTCHYGLIGRISMGSFAAYKNIRAEQDAAYFTLLGIGASIGGGTLLDRVAAHKWFNIAAARGSTEAALLRSEVAIEMTRDEIARAQRLAREYLATEA